MFTPSPSETYLFCGQGIGGTATKNTETAFDFKITDSNLYFSGAEAVYENAVVGDHITCTVIDKDNVLGYGTNYILSVFADNWYLDASGGFSYVDLTYAGQVPLNTYIRINYHSIGTELDPKIYVNLYIHKKI